MKLLKWFDFFGSGFTPTVAYRDKTESIIGGLIGLAYLGLSGYLCWEFGKVLVLKNKPFIIFQTIVNYDKKSNYSLPFAINNNTFIKPTIHETNMTNDEILLKNQFLAENIGRVYNISFLFDVNINNRGIRYSKPLVVNKCDPKHFTQKAATSNDYRNIDDSNCFHTNAIDDFHLLNAGEFEYRKVIIETSSCENVTGLKEDCLSHAEQKFYQEFFFVEYHFYFPVASFDAENFLSPFTREIEHQSVRLITFPIPLWIKQTIMIQDFFVQTDSGVFNEDVQSVDNQRVQNIDFVVQESYYDFDYRKDVKKQKFHSAEFILSPETLMIERSYPKIQDIIANVTGLTGIIGFVLSWFLQKIYDSQTYEILCHQLFKVDEQMINELSAKKEYSMDEVLRKMKELEDRQDREKNQVINKALKLNDASTDDINKTKTPGFLGLSLLNADESGGEHASLKKKFNLGAGLKKLNAKYAQKEADNTELADLSDLADFKEMDATLDISKDASKDKDTSMESPKGKTNNDNVKEKKKNFIANQLALKCLLKSSAMKGTENLVENFKVREVEEKLIAPSSEISQARRDVENSKKIEDLSKETVLKKKYALTDEERLLLNLCDHCLLSYCCCCVGKRTTKINNFYESLSPYIKEYVDICNISNNIFEVEKLKYLLLDEDQAALFNLRTKIHILGDSKHPQTAFMDYFYLLKDLNDSVKVDLITKQLMARPTDCLMNSRLLEFPK